MCPTSTQFAKFKPAEPPVVRGRTIEIVQLGPHHSNVTTAPQALNATNIHLHQSPPTWGTRVTMTMTNNPTWCTTHVTRDSSEDFQCLAQLTLPPLCYQLFCPVTDRPVKRQKSVEFDSKAKVGALVQRARAFKKQKTAEEAAEDEWNDHKEAYTRATGSRQMVCHGKSGRIWKDSGWELERF
ncbi:hypothetical protein V8E53_008938 [Lactarius tabidus]